MNKVSISFLKYAEKMLLFICRAALLKMTGNLNFVNIVPAPAEMLVKADEFEQAMAAAAAGDKEAIKRKNKLKKALAGLLRKWGIYVNLVSDGDAEIAASSGLPMNKQKAPTVLDAPKNLQAAQGLNPNSIEISCDAVAFAKSYRYEWRLDTAGKDAPWESDVVSTCKLLIENLEQGKKYWFRVVAIGTKKQRAVSNEIFEYVMQRSQDLAA